MSARTALGHSLGKGSFNVHVPLTLVHSNRLLYLPQVVQQRDVASSVTERRPAATMEQPEVKPLCGHGQAIMIVLCVRSWRRLVIVVCFASTYRRRARAWPALADHMDREGRRIEVRMLGIVDNHVKEEGHSAAASLDRCEEIKQLAKVVARQSAETDVDAEIPLLGPKWWESRETCQ